MAEDKTPELEFFTGTPLDQKAAASKGRPTPAKDFFTGTDFSTVPESYSTRRQLEDGLFINEITRPIKGNVEDYTKYGVPLYRGFDWDEIRARNQGTVEKWVNGIAKAGVVTATSFTENLLGVPMGIISMASGGDFFDNSLGRRIDKINDWMQENMPNYRTRQEENNSVLAGLGTANFWADTFLNGLGYSIGSIASVYATGGVGVIGMTSRLGSAAARGMGIYRAAKAIATGTKLANTLQKGARVGTNVLNAAKVADMGFMMALAESSVESRETKRNMLEMLQQDYMEQEGLVNISQIPADVLSDIEDTASAAGNTNFIANLAIVGGTNMFMFGKMALGFNGATKKLNNVIYDRALGKFVNTMPNQSVRRAAFEKAALLSRNSLGELAQEGGQYASNIYATEVHGEKFHDGGSVDRMQALNKAFTDTFGDKEGRESMLVGALVGLFMGGRGAFGPTQTQKDNGKREALVKILNSGAFNGISREMQEENVQSATIKKMELAAQRGDIKTFKDLQARLIQNHAFSLIERGGYDVYMEMLEDSKTLSDADFMDRFGFPKENEKGVPYTIEEHLQGKTKSQFIDGVKEKVEHVNKIYKNVNDMFPLPNQTQGLPRVLMGEAARAAEDRAFNRAYNLRRELAGYGYGLYDRARRRSQIVENIQKEIDNNPILKALNINVDSELAKIKELESADIKDMSNSFQTLADKEVEKAKVFDDIMSKINAVAQSPKIGEMIEDYLSLGLKDVSAIDAYNRLASDPNYRKAFHEELERNQATQKDSALDKKVEEVILGAKTSEELETQRPAADTMTDSQIEALRERKAELIKEEDAAKRKYLKRVENKTEEDALEDLKGIDRENLSPTDIVGLRSAIAVMQGKVDSIKNATKKGADAARNIFKGPQPQGDPNLTPEALGGVEKVSEDGRHFVINGKKYYNDKPNIEDVLKTPGKVTLKSENGNPATFTNDLTVQGITLAIKAAVARRESTSQPDNFNTPTGDKLIQQIDLFGDAVKYWTDQVTEAVKNKEIAPLPQRDYNIVRKEILDLVATLEVGNRLNDALSASKEGNNFSKSVIEKALGRLNTLINTRINTLEKVLQPTEATIDDITNLIEELTQQLETFKATDNNTSNATASKALTKYLTELIRFKIETLKNKLDDSSETDEDTEPPGPTPPTTPGPDAGQTGTGKATDPGTTSESQEFPVVTEETQELPDEPTSNVFDAPGQGVPGTGNVRDDVSSGLVPNDVSTTKTNYTFEGDQFNVTIDSIDKDGNRTSDPDSIVGYEVNVSSLNNEGLKQNNPALRKTFKTLEEAVKYGNLYVKSDPATNNTSEKESIDPVEPGQIDNSTRPPLFDEHGNIQITEESQELPDEPTRDVFETDPASPAQQASEVKQSNIDDLLSKEKTIKIGRYTPSSRFSDRVSGENLFLEVIDALNSIVSFNKTISSEQIKQIDEVLDLFAPVLSIKTIDRIIAKYEEEDANFLEVLDRLNKLKQKELAQISAMQGDESGAAQQPSSKFDFESMKDTDSYFWDFDGSAHFGNVIVYGKDHGDTKMSQNQDGTPSPMDKGSFQSKTFTTKQLLDAVSAKDKKVVNALVKEIKATIGQTPAQQPSQPPQQQGVQVMYTPKGKARQTYTIVGTKIFNANGKEVYKKDSADRRKIFANLAIQQKRARVVEYKGNKYIVNDKDQIMSVATGKIMQWGENDGNRKAILALAKPTTSTVSTNQYAATPPDATYTPKPGGMQLMNDASFKTRDSSGRYYVAVNPDGTPDLMAALMPDGVTSYGPVTVVEQDETELTEKVLIPNTGLLVSSSPGESVSFVLARELWFNDTLSNYEDFSKESVLNQRFEDIPIHVYKDGSFVGRLESANPTNRLERKEIVRRLAKGETVTAPITKIVGTNPNYARSTEDEQGYFSDPREIITGDLNIAAVSLDRGVMSLESGVESINEDFLEIASSINFSNLLPGSVVFKVNPSQTPNNEVNFVKGFTRNLDGAAINAVNRMLSEGNMEGVKEVVANSPASDSQSDTYLNIDKFGQTGQNFMVFKSPKLGRMVRVSSEEMLKAMRSNGVAKVGLVAFSDETDQFQTDKSAKVPKGYNVRKDFQEFIQGKKFQVDVEKANNNAPFYNPAELENGSPKYYESYQEYLFGDRYEGMNGHNSILSLDVVEVNGSIYHDLGVAFDRLSASGEAAEKVVAAVNNIKPAQVSGKIQAIRANRNLNNRRRNNNIQDRDDFYCD